MEDKINDIQEKSNIQTKISSYPQEYKVVVFNMLINN